LVRPQDSELKKLMSEFVCVRLVQIEGVDLRLFQFDFDLTWAGFFLSADERIYGRYGSRDAGDAEARISVAGLKHTMRQVLEYHRKQTSDTVTISGKAVATEDVFPRRGRGCMHCHQVYERRWRQARANGTFDPESIYVYPLPENVGLKLDLTAGNKIAAVAPDSPAFRAGLKTGDSLEKVQDVLIFSEGDVTWALHNAPPEGTITVRYRRGTKLRTAALQLRRGWRKTDLSWRASVRHDRRLGGREGPGRRPGFRGRG